MVSFLLILVFLTLLSWILFFSFLYYQLKLKGVSNFERVSFQFQFNYPIQYFLNCGRKTQEALMKLLIKLKKSKNKTNLEVFKREQEKRFQNDGYWREIKEMFKKKR